MRQLLSALALLVASWQSACTMCSPTYGEPPPPYHAARIDIVLAIDVARPGVPEVNSPVGVQVDVAAAPKPDALLEEASVQGCALPVDPMPGEAGASCKSNHDCNSNICVEIAGGDRVCTRLCGNCCPSGFACEQLSEQDSTFACLPAPGEFPCLEPGGFGCPCTKDATCVFGACVPGPKGGICSKVCEETCSYGMYCALVSPYSPIRMCRFATETDIDCAPCKDATDCMAAGVQLDCVSRGPAGSFCARACSIASPDCPAGTECQPHATASFEGHCSSVGGAECACSDWAKAKGASTVCQCTGTRSCGAEGLGLCDAPTPTTGCEGDPG